MAIFRNQLHSVSRTFDVVVSLKRRLTTCLQNSTNRRHQQQSSQQQQQQPTRSQRTIALLKQWNSKIKTTLLRRGRRNSKNTRNDQPPSKKELSRSATVTSSNHTQRTTSVVVIHQYSAIMTITAEDFLDIREAHPDLDAEVRSILLARARKGATIQNIEDDYLENTGVKFPIQENITEFLLSIPEVSAICVPPGTLIFNVVATEKTKHLYSMIMNQKTRTENFKRPRRPSTAAYNSAYTSASKRMNACRPNMWRCNSRNQLLYFYNTNKLNSSNSNNNNKYINYNNSNNMQSVRGPLRDYAFGMDQQQQQQREYYATTDSNVSHSESQEFLSKNCYYEDNCNYLYNRLANTPLPNYEENNFNNNKLSDQVSDYNTNNEDQNFYNVNSQPLEQPALLNRKSIDAFQPAYRSSSPTGRKSCLYSDTTSMYTTDTDAEAYLLDFPLLGDDFFLYMARMELKCQFKKGERVLQSGLCISGQTIRDAIQRVQQLSSFEKRVIINIGSVDIMQGRSLIKIEHDFRELITVMCKRGMVPILTTLAPLGNYSHIPQIKQKLERFNKFIKREAQYLNIVDIWSCLVNEKGQTRFDCFQNEPRSVTGTIEPYLFWNKIGRQRVLQLIESELEY